VELYARSFETDEDSRLLRDTRHRMNPASPHGVSTRIVARRHGEIERDGTVEQIRDYFKEQTTLASLERR